jgi:hypothetical protein
MPPQWGETKTLFKQTITLINQEKKPTPHPLHLEPAGCFAKGQMDMPIIRANQAPH